MRYIILLGVAAVIGAVIFIPAFLAIFLRLTDAPRPVQAPQTAEHMGEDISINVYLEDAGQTASFSLEEYVKGVVSAEMPAEFEMEALKAQAVAARTYAAKQMKLFGGKGNPRHPESDISSDYVSGQAFAGERELKLKWGKNYEKYWHKISLAVNSTRGIILTYNGELINAAYHSTSGERTASAKEAWGSDYPYLKSVECSWDKLSPRYTDTKEISVIELQAKLGDGAGIPAYAPGGGAGVLVNILERTESGRVGKVKIGDKILSGREAREKLELRSSNFTVEPLGDKFLIKTTGYGHGVGLCQYGANGQAKEGFDFRKILTYYYRDVTLMNLFGS